MDLVPAVAERLDEKRLDEPVAPNHRHGDRLPRGSELGRTVGHPVDEAKLVEPLEDLGDVGLRRAEALGELGRRHRVPAPLAR